jgi:hypothetical protein
MVSAPATTPFQTMKCEKQHTLSVAGLSTDVEQKSRLCEAAIRFARYSLLAIRHSSTAVCANSE